MGEDSPRLLDRPDLSYRLDSEERRSIHPGFDADVVEELLQWFTPGARGEVLRDFQASAFGPEGAKVSVGEVSAPDAPPQIQSILRRVTRGRAP
jgi:hypothetical protein